MSLAPYLLEENCWTEESQRTDCLDFLVQTFKYRFCYTEQELNPTFPENKRQT